MTQDLFLILSGLAVVASGLVAGVFLTFSDFVMKSLAVAKAPVGAHAMQLINRYVYGSKFLVLLLGMAPVSLLLAGYAYFYMSGPAAAWIIAGGVVYVIGVFLVTMACNVPMNKRLDVLDPDEPPTAAYWKHYAIVWTRWNHVRTLASVGSTACLLVGVIILAQG